MQVRATMRSARSTNWPFTYEKRVQLVRDGVRVAGPGPSEGARAVRIENEGETETNLGDLCENRKPTREQA